MAGVLEHRGKTWDGNRRRRLSNQLLYGKVEAELLILPELYVQSYQSTKTKEAAGSLGRTNLRARGSSIIVMVS